MVENGSQATVNVSFHIRGDLNYFSQFIMSKGAYGWQVANIRYHDGKDLLHDALHKP